MTDTSSIIGPDFALLHAIYSYRAAWYSYLAASLIDDNTPVTYTAEFNVLKTWDKPAAIFVEAEAAMRLAIEEVELGDSELVPSMMKAAYGWMKAENARRAEA